MVLFDNLDNSPFTQAHLVTTVPINELKLFFPEEEAQLIPSVMKGEILGEKGVLIRVGLMLFDIIFDNKNVGVVPKKNLTHPNKHLLSTIYRVEAEQLHLLCETLKLDKVWDKYDTLLENKHAFWNAFRVASGKECVDPIPPIEIEPLEPIQEDGEVSTGGGKSITMEGTSPQEVEKINESAPEASLENKFVNGNIQETNDCFLHQKGWKFKDALKLIHPDEINFYATRVSLGGLYELSKIYSETTVFSLYLMHDKRRILSIPKSDLEIKHQLEQGKKARACHRWITEETNSFFQFSPSERSFFNVPSASVTFRQNGRGSYLLGNHELTRDFLEDRGVQSPFETIVLSHNEFACNALQKQMGEIPWVDVKKQLKKELDEYTRQRKPEFIYYLTLWHLYQKRKGVVFEEDSNLQNTSVWKKLFDFQRDGAIAILEKLETYGGCILADSVGLGKTFTALAVIMAYQRMGKNVAVFCPKRLKGNWERFQSTLDTNPFRDAHNKSVFNFKLFSHTVLRNGTWQNQDGHNLNFSLIVIDESHNFRNDSGARYQFIQELLTKSKNTKVLMLTATPINNRVRDLKNQLKLLWHVPYGANQGELYAKFTKQVVNVIDAADEKIKLWQERYHEQKGNVRPLRYYLPEEYFGLLKRYVVARSVAIVRQDYAQFFQQGRSLPIEVCDKAIPGIANNISIREIVETFEQLTFVAYDLRGYFEDQRAVSHLLGMLKVGFLKRFESSVESARKTLDSLIEFMGKTRDRVGSYNVGDNRGTAIEEDVVVDHVDATDDSIELIDNKGINVRVKSRKQINDFLGMIAADCQQLHKIRNKLNAISPNNDLKLQDLKERIRAKMKMPVQKLLIFTAYKDTAEYLYENIRDMGYRVACVSGGGVKANQWGFSRQDDVLKSFAPEGQEVASPLNPLQILIATDCISEGQNLQDCVMVINYDIHWNPVRLTQRNGRINRIGSRHKKVTVVNYWPMSDVDEYLKIYTRVMTRTAIGGTVTDERGVGANMAAVEREAFFQNQRLKEMQMGAGNRPLEQAQTIKLYDTRAFVADFHAQEAKPERRELFKEIMSAPLGLYAISARHLPNGVETSVIFLLRKKRVDTEIDHRENYKLLMIDKLDKSNEWRCEFSDSKILQRYQSLCRENTEINQEKENEFVKLGGLNLELVLREALEASNDSSNLDQYALATYLVAGELASFTHEERYLKAGLKIGEASRQAVPKNVLPPQQTTMRFPVNASSNSMLNTSAGPVVDFTNTTGLEQGTFEMNFSKPQEKQAKDSMVSRTQRYTIQANLDAEINLFNKRVQRKLKEKFESDLDTFEGEMAEYNQIVDALKQIMDDHIKLRLDLEQVDLFSRKELNEYQGIVMDFHKLLHRWEPIFNEKKVGSSEEVDDIVKSLENVKMRINNFLSDVTEW